jgi:hypothetical protein
MPITMFLAAALLSSTSEPTTTEANVGSDLAQVRAFSNNEGERLWPGYGSAPFGFLLIGDKQEELICRDLVPSGFEPAGVEPETRCPRFIRPRSGFPDTLLAAMPVFGPPAVIVMGTPKSTGRTEAGWARTILHEHFHQWQYALPTYFDRTKALDLHGGDETGMWVLAFAFPYEDPSVIAAFDKASLALGDAVAARRTARFHAELGRYLAARKALATEAGARNWRYFEFQLWQEGVARWTEIQLGKAYPRADVRESAAKLEEQTLKELTSPDLPGKKREVVYAYGAAEAMLLEACGRHWRSEYRSLLSLGTLLESARARCAP